MVEPVVIPQERRPACAAHAGERAVTTCLGCGLFLCGDCAGTGGEPRCARCGAAGHPIPWEDPTRGRGGALLATLKALTNPDRFFASAPWVGGLKPPLYFALVVAFLAALVKTGYGLLAHLALGGGGGLVGVLLGSLRGLGLDARTARTLEQQIPELLERLSEVMLRAQAAELCLNPLSTALGLFVLAALTHPVARWLGGQGSFEGTFRVLAYATAAQALTVIPGLGASLATLAGIVLVAVGMRRAHGLSGGRAFVTAVWWIPLAVLGAVLVGVWLLSVVWTLLTG